jgi:hypothetical protein
MRELPVACIVRGDRGSRLVRVTHGSPAMPCPYRVVLSEEERAQLHELIGSGIAPARTLTRARILLKADHGDAGPMPPSPARWTSLPAPCFACGASSVEQGLTVTRERKRPDRLSDRILDGQAEARLIATACSTPPEGQARWSLRLLADELIRLEIVETISHETVRQTLKKTR